MKTDTIAAIATSLSDSGIGIIRISGEDAIEIADRILVLKNQKHLKDIKSHTIHYGYVKDYNPLELDSLKSDPLEYVSLESDSLKEHQEKEEILDEIMVSLMKAPKSYTTEDTVEINCHGGVLILQKVLQSVLRAGARMAEPGEFTKRAFLNGRIDLSKAEAVMDVIHAQNDYALQSSVRQLKGSVSEKIRELRSKILYEIAFIESALDDPEHISLDGYTDRLSAVVKEIKDELKKLADSSENGKIIKEGIRTVIVGKPNVGKSSLLNLLVGEEKAIVTDIAGTTRDTLEENIRLNGISLHIIDTAGIRSTEDVVEKIGVEKAKRSADDADLIIYVVDSSVPLDHNDEEILGMICDKKSIILLNKSDLNPVVTESMLEDRLSFAAGSEKPVIIKTSTKDHSGIKQLEQTVEQLFFHGKLQLNEEIMITNMRHKEAIDDAIESLKMVERSLEDQMPEDFYSIDLMSAYASLGKIIGEEVGEDLLNEIFSKFCMGK